VKPNTLLFTRDGTQIGNAIVVECVGGLHTLLTDYGTRIREMTTKDLSGLFVFGDSATAKGVLDLDKPWPTHKHYTRRGRCKTCGFHGCRILVNLGRECVDCYTTAAER
jgi:hypothetical protein